MVAPLRAIPAVRTAAREVKKNVRFLAGRFVQVNEKPVIVLGNQKTGTTSIAALLADYAGLSATLDLRDLSAPLLARVQDGTYSLRDFINVYRLDFSRGLIKEPHLTFLYEKLAEEFPEARFAMVVRDPRDNIRSVLNRLRIPGDLEQIDPGAYREVNPSWRCVLDGTWMGLEGRNYIEMSAARWNRAADIYLENRDRMQLVSYEDFLQDKEGTIARLAAQLGLSHANDISEKVDIQYQPRGNREVKWSEFFGSKNLARIEQLCARRMSALGYAPSLEPTGKDSPVC